MRKTEEEQWCHQNRQSYVTPPNQYIHSQNSNCTYLLQLVGSPTLLVEDTSNDIESQQVDNKPLANTQGVSYANQHATVTNKELHSLLFFWNNPSFLPTYNTADYNNKWINKSHPNKGNMSV